MGWEAENSRVYYKEGAKVERDNLEEGISNMGIFAIRYLMEGRIPLKGISHKTLHSPLIVSAYLDFEFPPKIMQFLGRHYIDCKHPVFGEVTRRKMLQELLLGGILREWANYFVRNNPPEREKEVFRV